MSRVEWLIACKYLKDYRADEKHFEDVAAMWEEYLNERKPQTKVISLDEWHEWRERTRQ